MRKGRAVTDGELAGEVPVWLQLVRQLREEAGNPPLRTLGASSALAHSSIDNILSNRNRPSRRTLVKLLGAFDVTDQVVEMILRAFDGTPSVQLTPPLQAVLEHTPTWLALLRVERYSRGNPTLRELAARSGLPRSTIGEIFRGTATEPFEETLLKLATATCENDPEAADQIMSAFDRRAAPSFPALDFDSRTDTARLADAVSDLAQAITDLAGAIHTVRLPRDHH